MHKLLWCSNVPQQHAVSEGRIILRAFTGEGNGEKSRMEAKRKQMTFQPDIWFMKQYISAYKND